MWSSSAEAVMAILCLVLGVLSVVGSSSSQDPPVTTVMTTVALTPTPNQPTDAAAVATTVSHPGTTTTSVDSTLAKTEASVRTTPLATTIAGPPGTVTTSSNKVPTAASSTIVPDKVTSSSAGHVTFTKQPATSLTVTTISQYSASPAGNSVTSPSGSPKQPERTGTTEASQISNATKGDMKTTASSIVTEATTHSRVADLPKGTMITTPALSSSASPPSKTASPTTAGVTQQIMTTTSATAKLPSSSSSVPSTATDLPTPEEFTSKKTTETNKVKRPLKNIEVKCTNITTQESYVKINIKGSAICDTDSMHTADGHPTGDTISLLVCKALKPGYQENQDKCFIRLARNHENLLVIAEAFIESHLEPKELYTQLKKNGDNSYLFSFDGADSEDVDVVSIPLISAIVSLAVLLLIIAAAYGCWHQRKARKREQRLTEELQTMENGYHDNPTLEVMETSPEMQEKKGGPNGELGDSWIVPLDNLTREDLEEEEDTHL